MNLRQLRCFAAAVEFRNMTRASERLHLAQPALGQHIRALELELDVPLLFRHSRGVTPTRAGERLYARARELFDFLERTKREVAELGGDEARSITLGLTPNLTMLVGADLQLAFGRLHPRAQLRIWEDPSFKLVDAIEAGHLDVALAGGAAPRPGLALTPVLEEELLFVCRPEQAVDTDFVSLDDVLGADLALGTVHDNGRQILARAAGRLPAQIKVRYELQSIAGIREILLRGNAASVMPFGCVANELRTGQLAGRRVAGGTLKSTLYIVRRSAAGTPDGTVDPTMAEMIGLAVDMAAERQGPLATRLGRRAEPGA